MTLRLLATMMLVLVCAGTLAGPREQAKRMHDRLAGVPPSSATLDQMAAMIGAGDTRGAALIAMDNDAFYDVTLKNMAMPWTNRDFSVFRPLNDYVATVIGVVRDGRDFRDVLSGDVLYIGNTGLGLPSYSSSSNAHYDAIETQGLHLKTALIATTQSGVTGVWPSLRTRTGFFSASRRR